LVPPEDDPLAPPTAVAAAPKPGVQLALVCQGRIWVANVDGGRLRPLTPAGERFSAPRWSPDGRGLLARWWHQAGARQSALYFLAVDGSSGRLLTDDPALELSHHGFSPKGDLVVYETDSGPRGVRLETGETRLLPGMPLWSPDGTRLFYFDASTGVSWLAEPDWNDARSIDAWARMSWQGLVWSPAGDRLAAAVQTGYRLGNTIGIYDLASGAVTERLFLVELLPALFASTDPFVTDGAPFIGLGERSHRRVWPLAWSSDGTRLLVRAEWTAGPLFSAHYAMLAAVTINERGEASKGLHGGASAHIIAYGSDAVLGAAAWSPSDAGRLTFGWWGERQGQPGPETFLYDLESGPVYSSTTARRAAWSPDGNWLALLDDRGIVLVDDAGQARSTKATATACTDIAWNPAADLGALLE
jgi:dipeptidyl aminopeptidase/acylaminoacyl peptidase